MSFWRKVCEMQKSFLAYFLLVILFIFVCLSGKAMGQEIRLATLPQHKQMGQILQGFLQAESKYRVTLLVVTEGLQPFVRLTSTNQTDFFITSSSEILRAPELKKGEAVGCADPEKVHLTTLLETGIKNIRDISDKLPEKPLSLGPKNSATENHAKDSIDAQRIEEGPENFKCKDKGGIIKCQNDLFSDQKDKLISREIKAYYVTGLVPLDSVLGVAKENDLELAAIPENIVNRMNRISIITKYIPVEIDMNKYENYRYDKIPTAGVPTVVAATKRADPNIVSIFTKALFIKNPFVPSKTLPVALMAIHAFMDFHPVSLSLLKEYGIELKRK